ncbi:MAG: class I SAM-dependent methyltransferase [Pseudohongiellaceae bacterium]
MLAHLWWAARLENTTPRLTVIDRCPTAALANRWFADSKEMEVRVIVEDVLKLERAFTERFDLVCNHNFFGQFPPDVRREVIGQCRRVLSPEGWLLTANRLRPGPGSLDTPYTLTRSQAESTLERVRMSLLQSTEPIPDSEEFQAALMAFLQGKRGYRIQSEVDFSNMLAEHGLAIMVSETGIVASPVRDTNPDCPQGSTTTHREILRVLARACDPELKRVNSASCNFGA